MLTAIAATEGDVHDGGDFIWLERSTATAETADAPAADPSREEDQPYPHQLVLALGFPTTEEYNFLLTNRYQKSPALRAPPCPRGGTFRTGS
jgi:hypothetical protein